MHRNKSDVDPSPGGNSRRFSKTIGKENSLGTSTTSNTQVGTRNNRSPGLSALGKNRLTSSQGSLTSITRASMEAEQRAVIVTATQTILEVRNFR